MKKNINTKDITTNINNLMERFHKINAEIDTVKDQLLNEYEKMSKSRAVLRQMTITVPLEYLEKIDKYKSLHGLRSKNCVIVSAIKKFLEESLTE